MRLPANRAGELGQLGAEIVRQVAAAHLAGIGNRSRLRASPAARRSTAGSRHRGFPARRDQRTAPCGRGSAAGYRRCAGSPSAAPDRPAGSSPRPRPASPTDAARLRHGPARVVSWPIASWTKSSWCGANSETIRPSSGVRVRPPRGLRAVPEHALAHLDGAQIAERAEVVLQIAHGRAVAEGVPGGELQPARLGLRRQGRASAPLSASGFSTSTCLPALQGRHRLRGMGGVGAAQDSGGNAGQGQRLVQIECRPWPRTARRRPRPARDADRPPRSASSPPGRSASACRCDALIRPQPASTTPMGAAVQPCLPVILDKAPDQRGGGNLGEAGQGGIGEDDPGNRLCRLAQCPAAPPGHRNRWPRAARRPPACRPARSPPSR